MARRQPGQRTERPVPPAADEDQMAAETPKSADIMVTNRKRQQKGGPFPYRMGTEGKVHPLPEMESDSCERVNQRKDHRLAHLLSDMEYYRSET